MDELHIAQFAALLRTLAKVQGRQVIVAVHERPLFEYLALELSPAFPGDTLITVELGRSAAGSTRYDPPVIAFEPDLLVAYRASATTTPRSGFPDLLSAAPRTELGNASLRAR